MLHQLLQAMMLTAVTMLPHATGGALVLRWMRRAHLNERPGQEGRAFTMRGIFFVLVGVMIVFLLLHCLGALIWAGFFFWKGGFADFETAVYFSIVSYATIGYGDVLLPKSLRIIGGLEGMVGTMLFGVSVAILVAITSKLVTHPVKRN